MDMINSPATQLENRMKSAMTSRIARSLCLLALAGAGVVAAGAEPTQDGHEQARNLLSGSRLSTSDAQPHSFAAIASAGVLDPQEQGRAMIVGRPAATTAAGKLGASREGDGAADRNSAGDPLEMARQMILGRHSKADSPKARLAGKDR
jgi:hypothetical protein